MITAIILTLNEERHIARCITSLEGQCARVIVVDSGSQDRTAEIATTLGATVLHNPWINYATQLNFAVDAVRGSGGWLFRIDADEVVDTDSGESLLVAVARARPETNGLVVQRRIHFMGRRIRHGDIEPSYQLRLWREGCGRCEQRWMDEHVLVHGGVERSLLVVSDRNENSLAWWTEKHNSYASREAVDALNSQYQFLVADEPKGSGMSSQAKMRRFLKNGIYNRAPLALRATLYFFYRYVFRLGFLDGREGFYFHAMQGFWYRLLVDAKVHEIRGFAAKCGVSIPMAIRERTGIDVSGMIDDQS